MERRRRSHIKTMDAVKAAIVILGLLFGTIAVLWVATRLTQHRDPQPPPEHRPGTSLWEEPAPKR